MPVSAVQKVDKAYFIYVLERKGRWKYLLKKTPVEVGASDNNFTEIWAALPANKTNCGTGSWNLVRIDNSKDKNSWILIWIREFYGKSVTSKGFIFSS